jgi:hypothetical protein
MQQVRKDSQSLADRVLFLGCPNSFAVDDWCGVFKYNFADNKAEFIEWLPQEWSDYAFTWIVPQFTIAPVLTCAAHDTSKMPSISVHRL